MTDLLTIARAAKQAARQLTTLSTATKNAALAAMANQLLARQSSILEANRQDVEAARADGMAPAMLDRLALTPARLDGIVQGLHALVALPDPVGETFEMQTRPNGLQVGKRRTPLGVVGVIYESRPNVTVDVAALCLKAGNATILRGGSEAMRSNAALVQAMLAACRETGVPDGAIGFVDSPDRAVVGQMLHLNQEIDVIIPRGGAGLINYVVENATVPVIQTGAGVCHTYVDRAADLDAAVKIVYNAKVRRPTICNALDTVLVHAAIADRFLPMLSAAFATAGVEMRCDTRALDILGPDRAVPASGSDWGKEFLALVAAVKVVDSLDAALDHIYTYSSKHSEAVLTEDYSAAMAFLDQVDAAAVYINASTQFTDGGEFGLGAEIGISTQKLHARGPMGLREMTTYKWIILGRGQTRP
ncbi:MAG: glutamate-5-semialdehyde dehydrogenase [Chloroflexota bacterium]|nr:glutamate-5-semialdehyde dehydrogenase [Chloroflexota bacterium]